MKKKYIYVITAMKFGYKYSNNKRSRDGKYHSFEFRTSKTQKEYFTIIRKRTWGWESTLKGAKYAIEHDTGFFLEDMYYPEIVIERIPERYLSEIPKEWWYKWEGTEEKGKYKLWKKPEEYSNNRIWNGVNNANISTLSLLRKVQDA